MRRKRNAKRGFTLVEVIVVLVILAILAAIMVPAMTGWIDKATEKRLITACRTCVLAAQTLAVDAYAADDSVASVDEAAVKDLAGVPGDPGGIAFDEAVVTQLTYTEDGESVTYTRNPTPKFTYGAGAGGGESAYLTVPENTVTDIAATIAGNAKWAGIENIDSSAADNNTGSNAAALKKALEDDGINFSEMNVAAWKYYRGNPKSDDPSNKGPFFYWTDTDISNLENGKRIAVMRYNTASGSYTAWEAVVSTRGENKVFTEDYTKKLSQVALYNAAATWSKSS